MPIYNPPLDDMRFVLNEVLNAGDLATEIPAYADASWDVIADLLDGTAALARDVVFPLNQKGDQQGCQYDPAAKTVKTPDGFKDGFDQYRASGIIGLDADPQYGGSGMPHYLSVAISEMMTAANFSLSAYPGLTAGACKAIRKFGNDDLKDLYLPKMLAGEWTGSMCLTEPQAGTDLGLIKTKAEPQGDGSYKITGNKIFITNGEHDLAGNIIHLVLARLPDAPPGIKGISLFLVPKFVPDAAGAAGDRNPAFCTGIEHKMGIHGSATCSMSFEGAKGWLVGEPHQGMKAMFTMMNDARLMVGMQGLGLSEIAYQNGAKYASERVQSKAVAQSFNPAAKSVPIINHANIRRKLMDAKCQIEAARGIAYETAIHLDLADRHPEPVVRENALEYASLMTPVIQSCCSDLACRISEEVVQMHGGSGFINETGVNQYYRDSIIAAIYEGTNDVQAMDFTFRKVLDPQDHMNRLGLFMASYLTDDMKAAEGNPALAAGVEVMKEGVRKFQDVSNGFLALGMQRQLDDIHAHVDNYLDMFGRLAMGRMWLKMMAAAHSGLARAGDNKEVADFYRNKLSLGNHYFTHVMRPDMSRLEAVITAGAPFLKDVTPDQHVPQQELGIGRAPSAARAQRPRVLI